MSGLVKAKKYDWKDSNMALFGSDTEKKVKKESAETEPAWQGAGQEVGIKIWRIVKFKVTHWPKEDYGQFFNGDSYIILNTYKDKDSDELLYDVHFWIGQYSTQDEYGTAAYKTVELDTFLDDKPVQHREVQGRESSLFKSYFPQGLTLLTGGAETGFRRVAPEKYEPRLFKVAGTRKSITVSEIPKKTGYLTSDDVFIFDLGLIIYQFHGENCNKDEKFKATQYVQTLRSERQGKPKIETLEEREIYPGHPFYANLGEGKDDDDDDATDGTDSPKLLKVSDEDGSLDAEEVKDGKATIDDFSSEDVFLYDSGTHMFVWVGKGASIDERKNSMAYAHSYLQKAMNPFKPVTVIGEGQKNIEFQQAVGMAA